MWTARWRRQAARQALQPSAVHLLQSAIELIGGAARRAELRHWLSERLRPLFDRSALPVTEDILRQWRLMIESGRKRGHPFSHPDILIAATAAQHGLIVVA